MPWSSAHQGRIARTLPDGHRAVLGAWSQIVTKGVALDVEAVCRESFRKLYDFATPDLSLFEVGLFSHSGEDQPEWAFSKQGQLLPNFHHVCTITADLKHLSGALEQNIGIHGAIYWTLVFDVCIRFGGTELEAYLEWEENGVTCTGPMTIIPENVV